LYQQCPSGKAFSLVQHPASVAFFSFFVCFAGFPLLEPEHQISERGGGKETFEHVPSVGKNEETPKSTTILPEWDIRMDMGSEEWEGKRTIKQSLARKIAMTPHGTDSPLLTKALRSKRFESADTHINVYKKHRASALHL
jgi:hypothetical protein